MPGNASQTMLKLASGGSMPAIGLGTWQAAPGEVTAAVERAIDIGYRQIDGAWVYGNEAEVGEAIRNKIKQGVVSREQLFVVSKLHAQFMRREMVKKGMADSLRKLGLEYVDLYLIHGPVAVQYEEGNPFPMDDQGNFKFVVVDHSETWKEMEALMDQGLARNIGLSNFNSRQVKNICDKARIQPANLQVECNIYFQQKKLFEFCKARNITFTAYAPIGSPGRPTNSAALSNAGPNSPVLLQDKIVKKIAAAKGKTVAQVCLKFLVQSGIAVIPKSSNPSRILENFQIFDFELSEPEMKALQSLDKNLRLFDGGKILQNDHPENPFKDEF